MDEDKQENKNNFSDDQLWGFFIEGFLLVFVGFVGFIGNSLCLVAFSIQKNKSNFHYLMLTIAVFDILYIFSASVLFAVPHILPSLSMLLAYKRMMTLILPLAHIGLTGSIYLTLAISLERYTTVCHPFFKFTHNWSVGCYLSPIITFAFIYNIPKFFELKVSHHPEPINLTPVYNSTLWSLLSEHQDFNNSEESLLKHFLSNITEEEREDEDMEIVPTWLRLNPIYIKVYLTYMNLIILGVIPIVLLLVLNIKIYWRMKSACAAQFLIQPRDVHLTQVSLAIVAIFIVCHSVRWIPNIWEMKQAGTDASLVHWPPWVHCTSQVSHLLTVFSSSANFYIYLAKHGVKEIGGARGGRTQESLEMDESLLTNIPVTEEKHLTNSWF